MGHVRRSHICGRMLPRCGPESESNPNARQSRPNRLSWPMSPRTSRTRTARLSKRDEFRWWKQLPHRPPIGSQPQNLLRPLRHLCGRVRCRDTDRGRTADGRGELAEALPDDGSLADNGAEDQLERLKEANAQRGCPPLSGTEPARGWSERCAGPRRIAAHPGQTSVRGGPVDRSPPDGTVGSGSGRDLAAGYYSPDEERPIDLVHRIDDQMQTTAEVSSNPATDLADSGESNPSKAEASKTAQRDESTGFSWRRGSGIGVFRRERKPATSEEASPSLASVSESPRVSMGLDLVDDSATNSRQAVVQANRSVALSSFASSRGEASDVGPQDADARSTGDQAALPEEVGEEGSSPRSSTRDASRRTWEPDSAERDATVTVATDGNNGPKLISEEVAPRCLPSLKMSALCPHSATRLVARKPSDACPTRSRRTVAPRRGSWERLASPRAVCWRGPAIVGERRNSADGETPAGQSSVSDLRSTSLASTDASGQIMT